MAIPVMPMVPLRGEVFRPRKLHRRIDAALWWLTGSLLVALVVAMIWFVFLPWGEYFKYMGW